MKTVRKLTINGSSYEIEDPNAASINDELTAEDQTWSSRNIVDKLAPSFTESGGVVACNPVEGYPLSIVSHIEPVQAGSEDPSPDNVRAISGFEQVKLLQGGKNLVDPTRLTFTTQAAATINGDVITVTFYSSGIIVRNPIAYPAGTYTLTIIPVSEKFSADVFFYNATTGTLLQRLRILSITEPYSETVTFDSPFYMRLAGYYDIAEYGTYSFKLQLAVGTTTEYETYRGNEITFDLGQTVYGGNLDWNTGLLTVTQKGVAMKDLTWVLARNGYFSSALVDSLKGSSRGVAIYCSTYTPSGDYSGIYQNTATNKIIAGSGYFANNSGVYVCDQRFTTLADFTAYLESSGSFLVYPLAEPYTVQLTPQEILALAGTNSIYSNTGNTDVSGKADPSAVIQDIYNKLNAVSATMTALTGV